VALPCKGRAPCRLASAVVAGLHRESAGVALFRLSSIGLAVLMAVRPSFPAPGPAVLRSLAERRTPRERTDYA
jgi:hypothetical protein